MSVDEKTHHRAQVRAAVLGKSVSELLREHLVQLAGEAGEWHGIIPTPEMVLERRRRRLGEIFAKVNARAADAKERGIEPEKFEKVPR